MENCALFKRSEIEVRRLGISVTYKGFFYLVYAAVFAVDIGMRKASLNKEIYDRIAALNDVTVESVEKCIRNSVSKAWDDSENTALRLCRKDGKKPTNGEVIAFISSRIRLERNSRF